MKRLFRWFGGPMGRRAEVDEEIEAHIAERIAVLEAEGRSPQEAREEAHRRFGDLERARRDLYRSAARRDRRKSNYERRHAVLRDLGLAWRRAKSNPAYTALTVSVFAIGIGLTTLTYGLVDQVLLRPLPFPDPDRLVRLESVPESRDAFPQVSSSNWADWRDRAQTLEATAIHRPLDLTVVRGERAIRVRGVGVAGGFFETLRSRVVLGRTFTEDEAESRAQIAVVSEAFWKRALGEEPDIARLSLRIDGEETPVVGVVRTVDAYPEGTDVWIPEGYFRLTGGGRNNINWGAVARVRGDRSLEQARTELQGIADGIRADDPEGIYSWGVGVTPLHTAIVGDVRSELRLLLWAALAVLLVSCVNLAGLSVTRGAERKREFAVRTALGARRPEIVQQLVVEQVALAVVGGALGILAAIWATAAAGTLVDLHLPRAADLTVDVRVVAVGFAVTLIAGLLAAVVPALRVSATTPGTALAGRASSERKGAHLPGASLVIVEVTLAVTLLSGVGLLVRSFETLLSRDLGYDPDGVTISLVTLTGTEHGDFGEATSRYWEAAIEALRELPGVTAAVSNAPPTARGGGTTFLGVEGVDDPDVGAAYRLVSDDHFEVFGIPVLAGRVFDARDQAGTDRIVVVNEALAEHFWPGQSALGRRVKAESFEAWISGGTAPWLTIVGVVGNVLHGGFEGEVRPTMYTLQRQVPGLATHMYVTTRSSAGPGTAQIRATLASIDPDIAVEVEQLGDRVTAIMAERRLMIGLLGVFSAVTLVLASIGVYGLIAFSVSRRRREMALRMALGAERLTIRGMVLGQGLRIVAVGVAIGIVVSFWTGRLLESFLVEVSVSDPLTGAGVATLLLGVGVLAILIPSARATRADPALVLRE